MKIKRSVAHGICAVIAISLLLPLSFAFSARPVLAESAAPGVDIGGSDGDRDGDGAVEGPVSDGESPVGELASDIGDAASRGMEEVKKGAEEIASGMTGDTAAEKDAGRETMDAVWVIVIVAAVTAIVAVVAVFVPRRRNGKA